MPEFGDELRIRRLLAHIKQCCLARAAGVPASRVCEVELGRRTAIPELAERLRAALVILIAEKEGHIEQGTT